MTHPTIAPSILHDTPNEIEKILMQNEKLLDAWNALTPIARNEWICWVTIVKQPETKQDHLRRLAEDLLNGKKRPCCWPGCPHRNPKNAKWFKNM
jgi:uncharacterized protein YdeI (YjbR/CyaY-like superfamily)